MIRLAKPSPAQREELRRLLGISQLRGEGISVRLDDLDDLLANAGICRSLAEAVVELTGPVANLRKGPRRKRPASCADQGISVSHRHPVGG
ncbi:MAG: hypothetical protein HC788_07165 [Sphingopyxis sp.]|nr:hypothetical protein [Sphingopyxis sp.]